MFRRVFRRSLPKWIKDSPKNRPEQLLNCTSRTRITDENDLEDLTPLLGAQEEPQAASREDAPVPSSSPAYTCNRPRCKRTSQSVWPLSSTPLHPPTRARTITTLPSLSSMTNTSGNLPVLREYARSQLFPSTSQRRASSPSLIKSRNTLWRRSGGHGELFVPILKAVKECDEDLPDEGQVLDDIPPPAIFHAAMMRPQPLHVVTEAGEEEDSGNFDETFDEKCHLNSFLIPPVSIPFGSTRFASRWSRRSLSKSSATRAPQTSRAASSDSHSSTPPSLSTTSSLDPFEDPRDDCSSLDSVFDTPDMTDTSSMSDESLGTLWGSTEAGDL